MDREKVPEGGKTGMDREKVSLGLGKISLKGKS